MPIARFQLPDGRIARFEVPEGTTPEQAQAMIAQQLSAGHQRAEQQVMNDPITQAARAGPVAEMSPLEKFNAGMGAGMTNIGRGLAQSVGMGPSESAPRTLGSLVTGQKPLSEAEQIRQRDAPLLNSGWGGAGNVAGNIVTLAPLAMVPGANTVGGAATIGALMGMTQMGTPVERLRNMALGFGAGGGTQALVQNPVAAARILKNVAKSPVSFGKAVWDTSTKAGRSRILGKTLNRAAGSNALNAQRNMATARELVPESYPTAGEASGSAGIASMQRSIAATSPEDFATRYAANNAARVAELEDLAGTHGAREFAKANLEETANELYKQARQLGIDLSKMSPARRGEITKLMRTPAIKTAIGRARALAGNEMENFTRPEGSVRGIDYVSRALGDMIDEAKGANERRILTTLRNRFLTTADTLSPEYAAARSTYAQMARPVTQMNVAQNIADRSIRALDKTLTPSAYARALNDKTAQSVTGMRNATLENTMEPDQLARLNALAEDLRRYNFLQNAGRGPGSDTTQKIALNNLLAETGMPTAITKFPLVGSASRWLFEGADDAMRAELHDAMLNPRKAAQLMSLVPKSRILPLGEPSQQLRDRMALLARTMFVPTARAEQQ